MCQRNFLRARLWDGREESSTFVKQLFKNDADYVTRRFNASSAGLK
jgi:hypothetical protein